MIAGPTSKDKNHSPCQSHPSHLFSLPLIHCKSRRNTLNLASKKMLLPQFHCSWTTKLHGNRMVSLTSVHIWQRAQLTRLESDLLQARLGINLKVKLQNTCAHAWPPTHWCVSQDKNIQERRHENEGQRAAYLDNNNYFIYKMSKG